jgi:hypothetical protein
LAAHVAGFIPALMQARCNHASRFAGSALRASRSLRAAAAHLVRRSDAVSFFAAMGFALLMVGR